MDALLSAPGAATVYASILEATAAESPKLRNGHTLDLFLLFRSDDPEHDRFMAEMLRGKPVTVAAIEPMTLPCKFL